MSRCLAAGLKQELQVGSEHLYHLIGLVAQLAKLRPPVECADFDLPNLLITTGLKPGLDSFAGLQLDDLFRSTL